MEMHPDVDSILSRSHPHPEDLLAVWAAYDRRAYWESVRDDARDDARRADLEAAEQQLAATPEITALQGLRAGAALVERLTGPERRDAVHAARTREGASWTTIGAALGITKQAAWEAFADSAAGPSTATAPAQPQSLLASREQAAQWRQETLDRLAEHPEIVATANRDAPGYWAVRTPDGAELDEVMGDVLADLHARGVRIRRGDGSPLDAFDWPTARTAST